MSFKWFGDQVFRKVDKASAVGINQTMSAAVLHAKRKHTFINRTVTLEPSIRIVESAKKVRGGVFGLWGSINVRYAAPVEKKKPYLVPAAEDTYPSLAGRIERALALL